MTWFKIDESLKPSSELQQICLQARSDLRMEKRLRKALSSHFWNERSRQKERASVNVAYKSVGINVYVLCK